MIEEVYYELRQCCHPRVDGDPLIVDSRLLGNDNGNKRMRHAYKYSRGFIAFSTVLVVSAVVLAVALSAAMLSIGHAKSTLSLSKGENMLSFVEGCAEDGLSKSAVDINYNGGDIVHPEGTCQITMSKSGNTWTMTASTADTKYKRTIQVIFSRTTSLISILSWKEI